jgi:hypothetical protein
MRLMQKVKFALQEGNQTRSFALSHQLLTIICLKIKIRLRFSICATFLFRQQKHSL